LNALRRHLLTNNYNKRGINTMKTDRLTKALLGIIAILLLFNLMNSFFSSKPALAVSGREDKGRYQISAWGVQPQNAEPRSGYYVLDTATGEVVASKMDVHQR
jgi:hypothetical protein